MIRLRLSFSSKNNHRLIWLLCLLPRGPRGSDQP
jgi:hypothetical protein